MQLYKHTVQLFYRSAFRSAEFFSSLIPRFLHSFPSLAVRKGLEVIGSCMGAWNEVSFSALCNLLAAPALLGEKEGLGEKPSTYKFIALSGIHVLANGCNKYLTW